MNKFCFLLLFAALGTSISGQQTYGDSILATTLTDTTKLRLLHAWVKNNAPNLREPVLRVALSATDIAQRTNDPTLLASAWNNLGSTYFHQEKPSESGAAFLKARAYAQQSGDINNLVTALRGITHYYRDNGKHVQALETIQEMETLLPKITDPTLVSACYTHFCNTYTALHRWKEVELLARRAIQFNTQNQLLNKLPGSYYHLGKSLERKSVLDSALFYMQKAQTGFANINNQEELAGMTMQIAQLFCQLKRPEAAVREMEKAVHIVERNRDSAGIAYVNMEKGKLMLQYARYQEAEAALIRSVTIFEQLNIIPYKKEIYAALSTFYEKTGQPSAALSYYKQYISIKDTIEGTESRKQLAELEATFENTKKEQQISLLYQENHNQRLQIGLLAALTALLVAGVLAALLLIRNRQRKTLLQEQKRWAQTVVDSTEAERKRIAADLHDGIAQQIAAIKMYAGGLLRNLQGDQRQQAEYLTNALDNTGRDIRQLAHQMMPRSLAELGLSAALDDLIWLSFSQTKVHAISNTEQYTLPPNLAIDTALYRVAQEAVNNILKYAQAKTVVLLLQNTETNLLLSISDDGVGFDVHKAISQQNTLGMESMQSRVRLCGGSISIVSSPENGTLIEMKIPILGY